MIDQDQNQDLDQVQGLVPKEIELDALDVGNMNILLENALMPQLMRNQTIMI